MCRWGDNPWPLGDPDQQLIRQDLRDNISSDCAIVATVAHYAAAVTEAAVPFTAVTRL